MSRVGKMPIALPQGVDVAVSAGEISVKGAQGTLKRALSRPGMTPHRAPPSTAAPGIAAPIIRPIVTLTPPATRPRSR